MQSSNRVLWLDDCKGLAIFFVILGHTLLEDTCQILIYGFHMPLFFFLSGLVLNEKKYTWNSFLKNRFNSLVVPYIAFYLLTWLYWLFVERSFRPLGLDWWQPLIGMVYGSQWRGYMGHNAVLWFLPCLFITEILFFSIKKIPNFNMQCLFVLLFAIVGSMIKSNLPWCLNIACVALQFLFVGNLCRSLMFRKGRNKYFMYSAFIVTLSASTIYIFLSLVFRNHVNMATNLYGTFMVFEPSSFIAIFGCVFLCVFLSLINLDGWGGWLGRNSLIIFALHQPILRVVRYLGEKIFICFPVDNSILFALIADGAVLLILAPVIWLYNKYGHPLLKKMYI